MVQIIVHDPVIERERSNRFLDEMLKSPLQRYFGMYVGNVFSVFKRQPLKEANDTIRNEILDNRIGYEYLINIPQSEENSGDLFYRGWLHDVVLYLEDQGLFVFAQGYNSSFPRLRDEGESLTPSPGFHNDDHYSKLHLGTKLEAYMGRSDSLLGPTFTIIRKADGYEYLALNVNMSRSGQLDSFSVHGDNYDWERIAMRLESVIFEYSNKK